MAFIFVFSRRKANWILKSLSREIFFCRSVLLLKWVRLQHDSGHLVRLQTYIFWQATYPIPIKLVYFGVFFLWFIRLRTNNLLGKLSALNKHLFKKYFFLLWAVELKLPAGQLKNHSSVKVLYWERMLIVQALKKCV